jgi:transposase
MSTPIFVRPLEPFERLAFEEGLRSSEAFTLRRCQILLASAEGKTPSQIAKQVRCASQTVRNVIHDFERRSLDCLRQRATIPFTVEPVLTAVKREQLQAILHQSPRTFGKVQSIWTLKLLAEVCYEQGLSDTVLSPPTLLDAIVRLGSHWKRAKHWVTSPDPQYALKKTT